MKAKTVGVFVGCILYNAGVEVMCSLMDWLFQNHELKDLLPYGFAIHHAGMTK